MVGTWDIPEIGFMNFGLEKLAFKMRELRMFDL